MSVHIHTLTLSQQDSVDIGGAFAPDFDAKELVHLLIKDILGKIRGVDADLIIIFMDELGNGNPSTLAAIQSLLEDGQIRGEFKAKNCVYITASNRPEDGCNAIKLPRSLVDGRLISLNMTVDPEEWVQWAKESDIHPKVVNPIRWRPTLLYQFDPKAKGVNPTPRGWEKLSNMLWEMEEDGNINDMDILDHVVPGCVGNSTWMITRGFWEHSESLATWDEIIDDPEGAPLPNGGDRTGDPPSGQFATAVNICDTLSKMKKESVSVDRSVCDALFAYFKRMEEEIAVFAVRICSDAHSDFADCDAHSKFHVANKHITSITSTI